MKKFLSYLAIALTLGAFILLCLIWVLKIHVIIPILMFAAAFVLLGVVKRMHEAENTEGAEASERSANSVKSEGMERAESAESSSGAETDNK